MKPIRPKRVPKSPPSAQTAFPVSVSSPSPKTPGLAVKPMARPNGEWERDGAKGAHVDSGRLMRARRFSKPRPPSPRVAGRKVTR
jgi:hypothetical protein